MAADRPPDTIALELRCKRLEQDIAFLARGVMRALTGQMSYTQTDMVRLRELIGGRPDNPQERGR